MIIYEEQNNITLKFYNVVYTRQIKTVNTPHMFQVHFDITIKLQR